MPTSKPSRQQIIQALRDFPREQPCAEYYNSRLRHPYLPLNTNVFDKMSAKEIEELWAKNRGMIDSSK